MSVHAGDCLRELVQEDPNQLNISREYQIIYLQQFTAARIVFQKLKTGEVAVRGTMEPVSKSKSIRVCVMVLTLLVEEPVPI